MPYYKVLAKFHGRKRREAWSVVKAKDAKSAINKAKAHNKRLSKGSKIRTVGKSWKAVKTKSQTRKELLKKYYTVGK